MTDDDFPQGVEPAVDESAARPLDDADVALLEEVARLLDDVDPVPADLVERIQFSLALDEVYAEVARIGRMPSDALGVRSDRVAGMRTETLTFSAERLTAMVTVSRTAPETVRVDGWIAPPGPMRVQLRMQEGTQEAQADEAGRFVFEEVPEGFAQLTFHPPGEGGGDDDALVVTPLFQL